MLGYPWNQNIQPRGLLIALRPPEITSYFQRSFLKFLKFLISFSYKVVIILRNEHISVNIYMCAMPYVIFCVNYKQLHE